jgi:hypothetical protein
MLHSKLPPASAPLLLPLVDSPTLAAMLSALGTDITYLQQMEIATIVRHKIAVGRQESNSKLRSTCQGDLLRVFAVISS